MLALLHEELEKFLLPFCPIHRCLQLVQLPKENSILRFFRKLTDQSWEKKKGVREDSQMGVRDALKTPE